MRLFKHVLVLALAVSSLGLSPAQDAGQNVPLIRAVVQSPKLPRAQMTVYIVAANERGMRVKTTLTEVGDSPLTMSDVKSYFVLEPVEYRTAYDALKNKKYDEALKGFRALREENKNLKGLPWNYGAFADFYEMETQRQMGNIDEMLKFDMEAIKKALPMESVRQQATLNTLWSKAQKKEWGALQTDVQKLIEKKDKLSTAQIAQLYYLLGLAYENQNKAKEAMEFYSTAMLIDDYNSMALTEKAITQVLGILSKMEETKKFMDAKPNPAEVKRVPIPVGEAAALAHMWKNVLPVMHPMPKEFETYLPFYKEPKRAEAKPAPKAAEKAVAPAESAKPAPVAAKK